MDADRFDGLTRALSQDTTRRTLTRLLGSLALSGFLPSLASAAKTGGNHETGHPDTGDHAKKDGTGHRKQDTDRPKTGNAERKAGKHRHQQGKTDLQDTAAPNETDTTGGNEALAPQDATTDAPERAGTVTTSATSEACRSAGKSCSRDRQCCSRRCRRGHCRCPRGRAECGAICCPEGQACVDRAVGRCAPKAGSCAAGADRCVNIALTCQGSSCSCLRAIDGETRCGEIISSPCGICGEHADCRRQFGYRAFCVSPGGSNCGCSVSQTFCARQCG